MALELTSPQADSFAPGSFTTREVLAPAKKNHLAEAGLVSSQEALLSFLGAALVVLSLAPDRPLIFFPKLI